MMVRGLVQATVGWVRAVHETALWLLASLAVVAVPLSGCVVEGGPLGDDDDAAMEPHQRIKGFGESRTEGSGCPLTATPPDWGACTDVTFAFGDFRCDPPQLVFAITIPDPLQWQEQQEERDMEQEEIEAPAGAYVHCTYALDWSVTGRNILPGYTLRVVTALEDQAVEAVCTVPRSGSCGVGGRIDRAFGFQGPDEEIEQVAVMRASIQHDTLTSFPMLPFASGGSHEVEQTLDVHT